MSVVLQVVVLTKTTLLDWEQIVQPQTLLFLHLQRKHGHEETTSTKPKRFGYLKGSFSRQVPITQHMHECTAATYSDKDDSVLCTKGTHLENLTFSSSPRKSVLKRNISPIFSDLIFHIKFSKTRGFTWITLWMNLSPLLDKEGCGMFNL